MWPLSTAARAMFGNSMKAPEFFAKQFTKHLAVVYDAKRGSPAGGVELSVTVRRTT